MSAQEGPVQRIPQALTGLNLIKAQRQPRLPRCHRRCQQGSSHGIIAEPVLEGGVDELAIANDRRLGQGPPGIGGCPTPGVKDNEERPRTLSLVKGAPTPVSGS